MITRWVSCAGLVTLGIVACASKSPDESYASAYSKAICDSLAPCCMANGFTFDKGQCELGGAGFVQSGNDAQKKAGGIFNQASADGCVAAVRALAAKCQSGADDPVATVPCKRVWAGTKAAGAACASNVECAPGAGYGVCFGAKDGMMGTCVVMTGGAKVGDVCTGTGILPATLADCEQTGLQCDALGTKTCIAHTAVGGTCGALTTCAAGFCDMGKCVADLAAGATCTTSGQCTSNNCLSGKCAANSVAGSKPCNGT